MMSTGLPPPRRRQSQDRPEWAMLADAVPHMVWSADGSGLADYHNRRAVEFTGLTAEELAESGWLQVIHPADVAAVRAACAEATLTGLPYEIEYRVRNSAGAYRRVQDRAQPIRSTDGGVTRWVGTWTDVEDDRVLRDELAGAARFRSVVMDTMAEGLLALDRDGRVRFINRSATRMLGWREHELRGKPAHHIVHYQHADGSPYPEEDCPVSMARIHGRTMRINDDSLVRKDGSMLPVAYSASPLRGESGCVDGVVVVFRDVTAEKAQRGRARQELDDLAWIGRIRDALDQDRLVIHAQPIRPLTGGGESEELLLRMRSASGDLVQPGSFLPIAEQYGLIGDIDRWVIARAVERAVVIGRRVEVNVSAWTIGHDDLIPTIGRLLRRSGVDPSLLVFELTETALMHDIEAGSSFAHGVHDLGCSLALDDFGTGFASFTYLKTLPFRYLKIDAEFVRDIASSAPNRHVVDAIVSLANGFGQSTIAEGVDDERTLEVLRERGVDFVQGFHVGHPQQVYPY